MEEKPEEFVEHAGVLWKRGRNGFFEARPYCPKCRIQMTTFIRFQHFVCPNCQFSSRFTRRDLEVIHATIPKK